MHSIRAGELRHRITIEQATVTQDDNGQPVETWSTYAADLPAEVNYGGGGESTRGGGLQASGDCRIRLRWLDGVTTRMRVVFSGQTLPIVSAIDLTGDRVELQLTCGYAA